MLLFGGGVGGLQLRPAYCRHQLKIPNRVIFRSLEEVVPRLEREKAHAEGELMKAVNAMSERESALSEVRCWIRSEEAWIYGW